MTTNSRFLALVAKVDGDAKQFQKVMIQVGNCTYEEAMAFKSASSAYRALKGEIMRHEPEQGQAVYGGMTTNMVEIICGGCGVAWPCKPFSDIEAEVGE